MRKTLQTNVAMNDPYDSVRPTQFSVIQTIHCSVGLNFFFNFAKMLLYMHILLIFHKVV